MVTTKFTFEVDRVGVGGWTVDLSPFSFFLSFWGDGEWGYHTVWFFPSNIVWGWGCTVEWCVCGGGGGCHVVWLYPCNRVGVGGGTLESPCPSVHESRLCPENIFWTAQMFVSRLGMTVLHHEPGYHVIKMGMWSAGSRSKWGLMIKLWLFLL